MSGMDRDALKALVEDTLRELHADAPGLPSVTLASALDRDLGFDSLAKTELLQRIETACGARLPDDTLQRAETVGDLLAAARRAESGTPRAAFSGASAPAASRDAVADSDSPANAETLLDALEWHLRAHPQRRHLTCLDGDAEHPISFRELADAGAAVAAGLQPHGVLPRQCVAIMLPTGPEYFST